MEGILGTGGADSESTVYDVASGEGRGDVEGEDDDELVRRGMTLS